MFPGLTHKAIKMKFKAEEKKCEGEVSRALRERVKAPDEVRKKMLEGVAGKRVLEDGVSFLFKFLFGNTFCELDNHILTIIDVCTIKAGIRKRQFR